MKYYVKLRKINYFIDKQIPEPMRIIEAGSGLTIEPISTKSTCLTYDIKSSLDIKVICEVSHCIISICE